MRPGLSPAAAAMAARLALVGSCAAPGRVAAVAVCSPAAVTVTWPVPRAEGRGVEAVCVVLVSPAALEASEAEAEAEGEGLRQGGVTAGAAAGAVEITVAAAVLLAEASVVPAERARSGPCGPFCGPSQYC